jgi:hypothetical protein
VTGYYLAGDELRQALRRMRAAFAGRVLPGEADYLAAITPGRVMAPGTTAPVIGTRFVTTPSGLVLPESAAGGTAPIDLIQTYITAEELLGFRVPIELVLDNVRRLPLESVLEFSATWLNMRHRLGANRQSVDEAFANSHLAFPARARAAVLLRDPRRALLAPQGLFVLMKMACLNSGDVLVSGVAPGNAPAALVGLMDHLGGTDDVPKAGTVVTGIAGRLGREVISNQLFHAHRSEAGAIRRFVRRWVELPTELASDRRVHDMAARFEEATGVALADLVLVLFAMWGAVTNGRPRFALSYFDSLGWSPERVERTVALFTTDIPHLRAEVRAEVRAFDLQWAIATFERYPVVRMSDGSLLVLDAELLGRRLLGILPLFDLTHALEQRGDRKLKSQVEGSYAHLSEAYALEVLTAATADADSNRFFGEEALRTAYGRSRQVADAAVDYGDAWVVVEITTSRPQRGTVSGQSDAAVDADLNKLVAKAGQIESTIAAIRANQTALTGKPAHPNPRFYPVLVVADGFPVNPISLTLLREKLQAAGVLQQHDTAPLEVLDLEELEIVEILAGGAGPSLRDLVAGHEKAGMANAALREYILVERRLDPRHGDKEHDAMDRMIKWALGQAPGLAA